MSSCDKPNIVWILTDQQPVTTVGSYGNKTIRTPHIDSLADGGVQFERAYVASFPCSPSRASLLSGLYAHHHGVVTNDVLLDEEIATLGSLCRAGGYETAYFGKWHLGGVMYRHDDAWYWQRVDSSEKFTFKKVSGGTGEDASSSGFDHWVGGWQHYRDYLRTVGFSNEVEKYPGLGAHMLLPSTTNRDYMHNVCPIPAEHHVESFISGEATRFIHHCAQLEKRPFAMVVSFYGPHLPVAPPRPWDEMYSLDEVPEPVGIKENLSSKPKNQAACRKTYADGWTKEQFKDYVRRYWGFVSYIDQQAGRVLQALEDTRQTEKTIVVFTSDHGDMIGEHGIIYKMPGAGYDILLRVPLVIRFPGHMPRAKSVPQFVSNIDVLPSVLELAGIDCPSTIDGSSFLPVVRGLQTVHRQEIYCDIANTGFMIREGRWKYCYHWALDTMDELYDLKADPHEESNLVADPSQDRRLTAMRERIILWLHESGHPYVEPIKRCILSRSLLPGGGSEIQ